MSGFDNAGVDREFFGGAASVREVELPCSLGYGDPSDHSNESPVFLSNEIAKIITNYKVFVTSSRPAKREPGS